MRQGSHGRPRPRGLTPLSAASPSAQAPVIAYQLNTGHGAYSAHYDAADNGGFGWVLCAL